MSINEISQGRQFYKLLVTYAKKADTAFHNPVLKCGHRYIQKFADKLSRNDVQLPIDAVGSDFS